MQAFKLSLLILVSVSFISPLAEAGDVPEVSKECRDLVDASLALIEKGAKKGDKDCIAADKDETDDPVLFQKCTKYSSEKMAEALKCKAEIEGTKHD